MKLEVVFKDGRKEILDGVESFSIRDNSTTPKEMYKEALFPLEGRLFKVKPLQLNRSYFENPRKDIKQEMMRKAILKAFVEMDKHPEKYSITFYTLIPTKKWNGYKSVAELKQYAKDLGGEMADWTQQNLEWAQRICNGERWESICNNPDIAKYYRVIESYDGYYLVLGGSRKNADEHPATRVLDYAYTASSVVCDKVPLVVFKNK